MANKKWTINLEDGVHTIELKHGTISGKRSILVDGNPLDLPPGEEKKAYDTGSTHPFMISGHDCVVAIRSSGFSFNYELIVDGLNVDSGLPSDKEESARVTPEAVKVRRIGVVAIFTIAGLICLWLNWRSVTTSGFYFPELAMLGPAALVVAAYYAMFPDDPWVLPKPFPIRLIIMLVLAFALGLANWYATENGLYGLIFMSG